MTDPGTPLIRVLLICLALNSSLLALPALLTFRRERDQARAELRAERWHSADLQRQLTSWVLGWERDGPYYLRLAREHERRGGDALMRRVRAESPGLTLEALLRLAGVKDAP